MDRYRLGCRRQSETDHCPTEHRFCLHLRAPRQWPPRPAGYDAIYAAPRGAVKRFIHRNMPFGSRTFPVWNCPGPARHLRSCYIGFLARIYHLPGPLPEGFSCGDGYRHQRIAFTHIGVFSTGAPLVGDRKWADYNQPSISTCRIANERDPVTQIPPIFLGTGMSAPPFFSHQKVITPTVWPAHTFPPCNLRTGP